MLALRLSACAVDLDARVIVRDGQSQALTDHEAQLLTFLAERPGEAVGRDVLLQQVWGYSPSVHSRAVDQTIKRLRPKIEANPREPEHLITVKGVGYRLDFEPPAADARTNVAPALDRFVGRDAELQTLRQHFEQGRRWVTITGSGGMGKTRLAAEFARRHQGDFPGGLWLCDLAQALDIDAMVGHIAATLQLAPASDTAAALSGLNAALNRQGTVLLVLDNLEQATIAAAQLGHALLSAAPEVRVLATSRARLGLRGEHVVALHALDEADGTHLLVDRAQHLRSDEVWSADDPDVREIARRLEGVPLALELAAARVVLLTPAQLLRRLDQRLDLLRGGPPGRHATLRHAIDWSWQLLTPSERGALARLSVFRGGFSVDEAERVIEAPDALDRLQVLVDRSLVHRVAGGRLTLLESIRQFAEEQLRANDEWEHAVELHATALLELARREERYDPTGWTVIGPLDPECDNLLAVMERQRDRDPERSAEALIAALGLLRRRKSAAAICELLDATLRLSLSDVLRSRLLRLRAVQSADPAVAQACMRQALDLAQQDPDEQLRVAVAWGRWLSAAGRPAEALEVLGALPHVTGDRAVEIQVQIGIAHARLGDWDAAHGLLRRLADQTAGPLRAMPLHALGFASLEFGRLDIAAAAFERALAVDPDKAPLLVGLRGILALERGDLTGAKPFLDDSRAHSHTLGDLGYMGEDDALSGYLAHRMGDLDRADDLYRSAQVLLRSGGKMKEIAHVWAFRAIVEGQRGQPRLARNALGEVWDWARALAGSDMTLLAQTLEQMLDSELGRPELDEDGRLPIEVRRLLALVGR